MTLVLVTAIPAVLALAPSASDAAPVPALIRASPSELAELRDVELLETYDAFALVRASPERLAALQAGGVDVEVQDSSYWIGLDAVRFDVRAGEPAIDESLRMTPSPERGLYIVHFIGPVKAEWLRELQRDGARVLHSLPAQAFLVEMDGAARAAVRAHRAVDFVGAYHPAYKIHPDLAATGVQLIQVVTVDADDVRGVATALRGAGLPLLRFDSEEAGILSVFAVGDLGVVRARLDATLIPTLARNPDVLLIEPYETPVLENWNAQAVLQTGLDPSNALARRLWDSGLRGAGQIISPADTGLDFDHNFFRESAAVIQKGDPGDPTGTIGPLSIYNMTDLTRRKLVRYIPMSALRGIDPWTGGDPEAVKDTSPGHGTSVNGNAAGNDAGLSTIIYDGMAIDAWLIIEDIGTAGDSLSYIPDNYDDLFGAAYDNGARVHTNSWGAAENGYDLQAMMVDRFVWNHPDMAIFFAAGNGGPGLFSVGSPGTAKSAVTIGGANGYPNQEQLNSQSARGPTADGRLKPDVVTFFFGTTSISSGDPKDNAFTTQTGGFGGTSHATPQGAGMGALVRQYFADGFYPSGTAVPANGFDPSAALVKATLAVGSRKMTGTGTNVSNTYPNNAQGWGRIALDDALFINPSTEGARRLWVADQSSGLSTGQFVDYKISVESSGSPLRIVLAWSDYPALPNANPALVNNLNLQVTSPTGAVYKGNVFGNYISGQSVPNSGSFDSLNPVEGVIVNAPAVGEWTLRVEAVNVPSGPQPYSVAVAGELDLSYGNIRLDKKVYSESDTVGIEVLDANAAGVTVDVRSTLETTAETVTLTQTAPGSGVWRGTIDTGFGDPVADGILQVNEGGTLEAIYTDVFPPHVVSATASIDASPPSISNVRAEDITNSAATIKWTTNEPANSRVYYGTTTALGSVAFDSGFATAHAMPVVGLATDTVYYYDVESADALGHTTRDDNGGAHYAFRTTAQGEILVVIGETSFTPDRVAMYRDALAGSAWTFNEWHVALSGDPPLAVLQQYKVVIWQTGLESYPQVTDAQRPLIKSYLDAGGRLFLTSHDITWASCATTGNPYYTPERCSWVRSVLKTWWQNDPTDWTRNNGLAGDPISGPYTSGVNYVGARSGGYGDEVDNLCRTGGSCTQAAATATYVWTDSGGVALNDHIALKFESTGNNGTLGTGVWGGKPTKVVAFYFEWSGINYVSGVPSDAARTDVLNRTIIWLIGRDHPAVLVKAPNGGETITTDTTTIQWSRTPFGGSNIAAQRLYYSDNSGQSWNLIGTTPSPADTSYVWDVSALSNGGRYRVRVIAEDDGDPVLSGSDASNGDFAINRAGGDAQGPLIWPGSVTIVPNPIVSGSLVTFTATADDSTRGNSDILQAELFEGATEPLPGAFGTGIPMNAADAAFDEVVEGLTYTAAAPWTPGNRCFWVHGRDLALNWGPFESRCTAVTSTAGTDTTPPVTTAMSGTVLAGGGNDVRITWAKAMDEGQIGGTVAYRVMRSITLGGVYAQVGADRLGDGSPSYPYTDVGAGDGAPSLTYFYFIRTVDQAGNTADGTDRSAKLSWDLAAGITMVAYPLVLADTSLSGVFQTSLPRGAWTYDAATESWLTYSNSRPAGQNNLRTVARTQGVYVDLAAADRFTVAGLIPASTTINLASGWNLVSFPSFVSKTVTQAMSETGATAILAYDPTAPPGYTRTMAGAEILQPGRAYWIKAVLPVGWTLPGR